MKLTVESGPDQGAAISITAGMLIGREDRCDLTLRDPRVSRLHAHVGRDPDGTVRIRDLGSSNGTLVDGRKVEGATQLRGGERIQVGDSVIGVVADEEGPGASAEGRVIGRYRVERRIGQGSTGVVYLAEQVGLGRKVALKLMRPELFPDPPSRGQFLEAWRTAASLDHPNIIPVYDADDVDGELLVAMRFVDGENLDAVLARQGPLEPDRAVDLIAQVGRALDAAHFAGLVHRVVKPANVLTAAAGDPSGEGHAFLCDFGLARLNRPGPPEGTHRSPSSANRFVAAALYPAPEQIRGEPVDGRTDIYGVGCLLYECLTGHLPFDRETEEAVMWAHVHDEPPRPSDVRPDLPRALDQVVAKAMAKDPAARHGTCAALAAAAQAALTGGPPEAQRVPATVVGMPAMQPAPAPPPPPPPAAGSPGMTPAPAVQPVATAPAPAVEPAGVVPPPEPSAPVEPVAAVEPEVPAAPAGPITGAGQPRQPPAPAHRPWTHQELHDLRRATPASVQRGVLAPTLHAPTDQVDCSVFAPPMARPGDTLFVQVFAHLLEESAAGAAAEMAREFDQGTRRRGVTTLGAAVARGSRLTFDLTVPGLGVDEPVQSLTWNGQPSSVQYAVTVPPDATPGTAIGTVAVMQDSLPIGHVKFKLDVLPSGSTEDSRMVGELARRYSKVFFSYASTDRPVVLQAAKVLQALGVSFFQDVLNMEPGEHWEQRLYSEIDRSDLVLLFWSTAARASDWVRREVLYALKRKQDDEMTLPEIRPLIIEGPPVPPPWDELAHLHFNDRLMYLAPPA